MNTCRHSEPRRRFGRNRAVAAPFRLLAAAVVLAVSGCGEKVAPGAVQVQRPEIVGVTVAEVRTTAVPEYYETSGTVRPRKASVIAARTMGTVTDIAVREGDAVRSGQLLLTIDDRDAAQRVLAAGKALETAQQNRTLADVTYQRYKKLYDEKALSQQEIDQIESRKKIAELEYERAKAQHREAQINHGFSRIASPASGIVTEKKIEAGSLAVPGAPLLVIEDTSSYLIEANVDERWLGVLRPGRAVEVSLDAAGRQVPGRITEIVPAVSASSRTFLVKIDVGRAGLRSGLYAKVRIPVGTREAVLAPQEAVVEKGQLTGVYAVDTSGVVAYRLVRVGKRAGSSVEILSGLNAGDRIITDGVHKAVDGGILRQGTGEARP